MVYEVKSNKNGQTYYLHRKIRLRKNGTEWPLYYFCTKISKSAVSLLPEGFEVFENVFMGLPFLKKIKKELVN